jgi:hypothetical protein
MSGGKAKKQKEQVTPMQVSSALPTNPVAPGDKEKEEVDAEGNIIRRGRNRRLSTFLARRGSNTLG